MRTIERQHEAGTVAVRRLAMIVGTSVVLAVASASADDDDGGIDHPDGPCPPRPPRRSPGAGTRSGTTSSRRRRSASTSPTGRSAGSASPMPGRRARRAAISVASSAKRARTSATPWERGATIPTSTRPTSTTTSRTPNLNPYFPLKIGYTWEYAAPAADETNRSRCSPNQAHRGRHLRRQPRPRQPERRGQGIHRRLARPGHGGDVVYCGEEVKDYEIFPGRRSQ